MKHDLGFLVASNIRNTMREKRITQEMLGRKVIKGKNKQEGISVMLKNMEKNGSGSLRLLSEIAKALDVDVLNFFK